MTVPAWCARLGMTVPVVQAPIGSACTPELAAAVSGAGALGMLAGSWLSRPELVRQIRDVRTVTSRSFGVNLVLDRPQHERLGMVLDLDVSVISTFWGDPEPHRARIADHGALHLHTVGSSAEARCAVAAGVDLVVAQGWDAGGHVRGRTGTFSLVPAVVDAVAPVPVIAAGGIADVCGVAAAFALGAQGVCSPLPMASQPERCGALDGSALAIAGLADSEGLADVGECLLDSPAGRVTRH